MPFCPTCRAEYKSGVTSCADDSTALVDRLQDDPSLTTLTEIYASYLDIEAERLRSLLEDEGIACYLRSLRRAAFPTGVGSEAPVRVAVPVDQAQAARALIEQARADAIISEDGSFVKKRET